MERLTPERMLERDYVKHGTVVFKEGQTFTGKVMMVPEGSWDEDDTPQIDIHTDEGLYIEDLLSEVAYVLVLDD